MEQQGAPRTIKKKQTKKEAKNARKPLAVGMRVELLTGKLNAAARAILQQRKRVRAPKKVALGGPPRKSARLQRGSSL